MTRRLLFFILFSCFAAPAAFAQKERRALDSMLHVLKDAKADTNKAMLLQSIAVAYWVSDHSKGRQYANSTLLLSERLKFKLGKGLAYSVLANIETEEDNLSGAMKYYLLAVKFFDEAGHKLKVAAMYANIGVLYYDVKNDSAALYYLNECVKQSEKAGAKTYLGPAYTNIGNVLSRQKKHDEALAYYFKSLKIREELDDKAGLTTLHRNIGNQYKIKGNFEEAINHTKAALKIAEEIQYNLRMAECHNSLGVIYSLKAEADTANKDPGKYKIALEEFEKSTTIARAIKARGLILRNYEQSMTCYGLMDDYVNGANIAYRIIKLKDTLNNDQSAAKIEQVRLNYENEKLSIETKARQDKGLAREKLIHLQDISAEQLKHEQELADERLRHEQDGLRQKASIEKTAYLEKARIEKASLHEKIKQEKLIAEQSTKNNYLLMGIVFSVVIVSSTSLFFREKRLKTRAIERANAMHQMAELELQSLRTQLNPHFMFNSLNAIQELILMEDNERSHIYLSRFSKLLRILLENATLPFIPVSKELSFLHLYLSLENLRIPDLVFSIETDPNIDPENVLIPNMILQPYIENAIWHGLSHRKSDRQLGVTISRKNDTIVCAILDNGVGRRKANELKNSYRKGHNSKGMELLSRRFNILSKEYGETITVHFTDLEQNGDATGTLVEITIPSALSDQAKLSYHDSLHHN